MLAGNGKWRSGWHGQENAPLREAHIGDNKQGNEQGYFTGCLGRKQPAGAERADEI